MNERTEQIRTMHAGFIVGVVEVCTGRRELRELEAVLNAAEQNGWESIVVATRKIVAGNRETSLLNGLDEEDSTIVAAILQGIQNPDTLPKTDQPANATHAAPGLASIIHSAAGGDLQALQALSGMAEQMSAAGGEMAQLAAVMRRLLNGERDIEKLSEKMGPQAQGLLISIIDELTRLRPQ